MRRAVALAPVREVAVAVEELRGTLDTATSGRAGRGAPDHGCAGRARAAVGRIVAVRGDLAAVGRVAVAVREARGAFVGALAALTGRRGVNVRTRTARVIAGAAVRDRRPEIDAHPVAKRERARRRAHAVHAERCRAVTPSPAVAAVQRVVASVNLAAVVRRAVAVEERRRALRGAADTRVRRRIAPGTALAPQAVEIGYHGAGPTEQQRGREEQRRGGPHRLRSYHARSAPRGGTQIVAPSPSRSSAISRGRHRVGGFVSSALVPE